MSNSTILIPRKDWTFKDVLKGLEAQAGPTRARTAGSWVLDIAAMKTLILLCPFCTHKFNPNRVGYRKDREFNSYRGKCDGCGTLDMHCTAYFHEEVYKQARCDSDERRTRAKDRARAIKRGYFD